LEVYNAEVFKKKHYSTDDLEMKPPLITINMMQRKDISKYIYKYFIQKDEKDNFVKGIVKWEHKLDTELDGSMLFKYFVIYLQV
jgi:hypothetical protein